MIYTKTGSHFHYGAGGFFDWYIGETESGYILASEEGFWSTGVGELTFHEYYLTQNGEVCDVSTISIASGDYEMPAAKQKKNLSSTPSTAPLHTVRILIRLARIAPIRQIPSFSGKP